MLKLKKGLKVLFKIIKYMFFFQFTGFSSKNIEKKTVLMDPSVLTTLKILLIGQSGVGKSW